MKVAIRILALLGTFAWGGSSAQEPHKTPTHLLSKHAPGAAVMPVVESESLAALRCDLLEYGLAEPRIVQPVVRVEDFGAKGDGISDDTAAINRAVRSLAQGGTVIFTAGKVYRKTKLVRVDQPGVKLWGYGATIFAEVTEREAEEGQRRKGLAQLSITLRAPNTGVYGLTIASNLRRRLAGHENNSAIVLRSKDQEVVDNRFEYTGNGVLAIEASDFFIARNVVYRTSADGIHITQGTKRGKIVCNVVRETGDDMIAIVNYGKGDPTIQDFLVQGNDVAGQFWGRGISVVGGRNVTIRQNKIADTTVAAAIYLASENSWWTTDVDNVLVVDNDIRRVQTTSPSYTRFPKSKAIRELWHSQGGIHIEGQKGRRISRVLLRANEIDDTRLDGVLLRGNVCIIGIQDNVFSDVGRDAIRIESKPSPDCPVGCSGNLSAGAPVTSTLCGTVSPDVTGAGPWLNQ